MKIELKKELLAMEVKKTDYLLSELAVHKGKLPVDNPLPFEDALSALWSEDFQRIFLEHLDGLIKTGEFDVLWSLYYNPEIPKELIEYQLTDLIARLDEPFTLGWAAQNSEKVNEIVTEIYVAGGIMAQLIAGVTNPETFQFNLIDTRAIEQLNNMGVVWASTSTSRQIITPIATRLAKQSLELGLSTTDAGILFKEGLASVIPLRSDIYYKNLASIVINRARNFSRILAFDRMGYTYAEVIGIPDNRQCGICMSLSGTVVRISDLVSSVNRVINATTPEDLINATPFINGIDTETNEFVLANGSRVSVAADSEVLAQSGIMLPLHPECRCQWSIWHT